jgi:hypothetical protein
MLDVANVSRGARHHETGIIAVDQNVRIVLVRGIEMEAAVRRSDRLRQVSTEKCLLEINGDSNDESARRYLGIG